MPLTALTQPNAALVAAGDRTVRLAAAFAAVRDRSERLTEHLSGEDMVVQSMEDASPAKWHLAHTG